jgi:multidrug resistance efflux pump
MPEAKKRPVFRPAYVFLAFLALAGMLAVYWRNAGQADLAGEVNDSVIALHPGISGIVSRIEVREGQRVGKGQALARLDANAQRKVLAEERQKLAQLETALPSHYLRRQDGRLREEESLEERLLRRRKEEEVAERRLQQAAEHEAQVSILYNRVMLAARENAAQERAVAIAALDAARQATREARAAFESVSHARSAIAAEMRRVKDTQRAAGIDGFSAEVRIKNYELQRERVRAAEAALDAATIYAPENGIITEIAAKEGSMAVAGAPCLYMASLDAPVTIVAHAEDAIAKKLRPGQQCRLSIAGASDNPYYGYISGILPESRRTSVSVSQGEAVPGLRVLIALADSAGKDRAGISQTAPGGESTLYLLGGAKADISVLLREPLYTPAQWASGVSAGQRETDKDAAGAAPSAGLSTGAAPVLKQTPAAAVREASPPVAQSVSGPPPVSANPEGRVLPPVSPPEVKTSSGSSQGPLESTLPLPQLPPMQLPEQLPGNSPPERQNSPSLVTPEILDREANSER